VGALRHATLTTIVWVGFASAPLAGGPSPTALHVIVVRTYNTFGLPTADLQAASRTVKRVLADVAIESRWRNCPIVNRGGSGADQCRDPLAENEVIVRLVGGVAPTPESAGALGYAFVDPVMKRGSLATIYADRIARLSKSLHVDRGTLLGRAVAHEVGHLLLGSQDHAASGLMRGLWSTVTILENRHADWAFTREEGADMSARLDARQVRQAAR
jgi:hypothetical protein